MEDKTIVKDGGRRMIALKRGNTTFFVGMNFKERGKEDINDRIKRLAMEDMKNKKV